MCTGIRIVRAWSAIARVIACLIHQVAYVENLNPLLKSNFSTALIKPILPSWIKSKNNIPRPTYRLAILTTKRKFASANRDLAISSPCSILFASSISSWALKRLTLPISFKYIRTGSLILTPGGALKSLGLILSSVSELSFSLTSVMSLSFNWSKKSSIWSESISKFCSFSAISSWLKWPSFFPLSINCFLTSSSVKVGSIVCFLILTWLSDMKRPPDFSKYW